MNVYTAALVIILPVDARVLRHVCINAESQPFAVDVLYQAGHAVRLRGDTPKEGVSEECRMDGCACAD